MRKITAALAATLMAAVLVMAASACAAAKAGTTRIMLVGDSITQGATGDYTWRYFLWQALSSTGKSYDFVGPKNTLHRAGTMSTDEPSGVGYAAPGFDQDHAARWGMGVHWIDDQDFGLGMPMDKLMADHKPDVVVDLLGYNDLNPAGWNISPKVVAKRQGDLIAAARAANPEVTVLLGRVGHEWMLGASAGAYNKELELLVADLSTEQSKVVLVPASIVSAGMTYDNAHPNLRGELAIAENVRKTLVSAGVVTGGQVTPPAVKASVKAIGAKKAAKAAWEKPGTAKSVELWKRVKAKKNKKWTGWKRVGIKGGTSARVPAKKGSLVQFKVRPVGASIRGLWSSSNKARVR